MISPSFSIARHEWKLILKEPRFLAPFIVTPMVLLGVQIFAIFSNPEEAVETLRLARSLLLMLAVLAPSVAVPLGADSFAGEKERNTLEILLCLPVDARSLFWGKVLGIFPLPVMVGWLGQAAVLLLLAGKGLWIPGFGMDAAKAVALTPVLGLFLASLSALISLGAESVRGAAQLTSLVLLGVFFAVMFFSTAFFNSDLAYAGFALGLSAGAILCLRLAERRFLKLP